MSFRLKNRTGEFPPNGWIFKDPKTGMVFDQGDFYSVVRMIIAHRSANPRVYPSHAIEFLNFDFVSAELDRYTCQRLNNSDRFCESGEPKTLEPEPGVELTDLFAPCYKCGFLRGYPIICSTCAGRKTAGFICGNCKIPLGKG